jgi:hypothetical protein
MDTSELRKRILHALDAARKDAVARRSTVDEANRVFASFLETTAVPLLRQAQAVLKAEGQLFTVEAPAGGARLVSDKSADTFIEFALDIKPAQPQVVGRVSLTRGRQGVVEERPITAGKAVADLGDDDVAKFLVTEIPKLVLKP